MSSIKILFNFIHEAIPFFQSSQARNLHKFDKFQQCTSYALFPDSHPFVMLLKKIMFCNPLKNVIPESLRGLTYASNRTRGNRNNCQEVFCKIPQNFTKLQRKTPVPGSLF